MVTAALYLSTCCLFLLTLFDGMLIGAVGAVEAQAVVKLWLNIIRLRFLGEFFGGVELTQLTVHRLKQLLN